MSPTSRCKIVTLFVVSMSTAFVLAQGPAPQPVQWTITPAKADPAKVRDAVSVEVSGTLSAGWHVYALHEPEGGPTPLRVTLDDAGRAEISGKIGGTAPTRRNDTSFQMETELYLGDFTLLVPVRLKPGHSAASPITIAVRYQACNDRICLPPRTVHLSTPIQ